MNQLHDEFQRQAPPAPSAAGWADEARRRHRRTNTVRGVVATVAVVALAVPTAVWLNGRSGDPYLPAEPAPTTSAPTTPAPTPSDDGADEPTTTQSPVAWPDATQEEMCAMWTGGSEVSDDAWVAVDDLPDGPARIWLCNTAQPGEQPVVFPADPLTGEDEVAAAIDTINGLPTSDPDQACTMEFSMLYTVLYEYADGTVIPAQGETHGCLTVRTGPADDQQLRDGAGELLDELTALWSTQRTDEAEAQGALGEEACKLGPSLVGVVDSRIVGGYACDGAYMADGPTVAVDASLARRIVAVERELDEWGLADPLIRIALVDDLGGNRVFNYDGEYLMDESDWETYGRVPDDLRDDLAPLVEATR